MNHDGIVDMHTHRLSRYATAIVSVSPDEVVSAAAAHPGAWLSTGLHPWDSSGVDESQLAALCNAAMLPEVRAVGETGLDALRGAPLMKQIELFRAHIELSESLRKPLIVHLVKSLDTLLALRREIRPVQPWIVHGFRGKPMQARTLLDAGCMLSLGQRFNAETARYIPADSILTETDDSSCDIAEVIALVAKARGEEPSVLTASVRRNIAKLFDH